MSGSVADPSGQPVETGEKTAKTWMGQPAAGKSEEKHCRQTLAGQGLPFILKPQRNTVCLQIRNTTAPDITPQRACKQDLCERGRNRC